MKKRFILAILVAGLCGVSAEEFDDSPLPANEYADENVQDEYADASAKVLEEPASEPISEEPVSAEPAPLKERKKTYPREHRGFFFSAGAGISYMSLRSSYTYDSRDGNGVVTYLKERVGEYSGFGIPSIDLKFGFSIANIMTIHSAIGMSFYSGEGVYSEAKYENGQLSSLDEYLDPDRWGGGFYGGLGFSVYPFKSPKSALNGFHFGYTAGVVTLVGESSCKDVNYEFEVYGVGNEIEVGKDWWISDTWSIGVSAGYLWTFLSFDDEGEGNRFQLMFRITHR